MLPPLDLGGPPSSTWVPPFCMPALETQAMTQGRRGLHLPCRGSSSVMSRVHGLNTRPCTHDVPFFSCCRQKEKSSPRDSNPVRSKQKGHIFETPKSLDVYNYLRNSLKRKIPGLPPRNSDSDGLPRNLHLRAAAAFHMSQTCCMGTAGLGEGCGCLSIGQPPSDSTTGTLAVFQVDKVRRNSGINFLPDSNYGVLG